MTLQVKTIIQCTFFCEDDCPVVQRQLDIAKYTEDNCPVVWRQLSSAPVFMKTIVKCSLFCEDNFPVLIFSTFLPFFNEDNWTVLHFLWRQLYQCSCRQFYLCRQFYHSPLKSRNSAEIKSTHLKLNVDTSHHIVPKNFNRKKLGQT